MVTWSQSGKGYIPLHIHSVQQLAIASGFVFEGEHDLAKLANLGGIIVDTAHEVHYATCNSKLMLTLVM